jgi:hypothetical protein
LVRRSPLAAGGVNRAARCAWHQQLGTARGHCYGTIVLGLEQHRPVAALLRDHDTESKQKLGR